MTDRMTGVRTVLLDVDGTLIDSNDAHAHAWVDAAREAGHHLAFDAVRPLIGMGGDKLMPRALGLDHESREGKALAKRRGEIFRDRYLPGIRPFPDARALLIRLRDDGYTLVVATSAREEEMKGLLQAAGVDDLLDDATSSSDAEHSKPDPDIVAAALEKAGTPASATLMLGDTPYDVAAAVQAGVPVVGLECGGWPATALQGAIAVYADPSALLRAYETSPFSRRAAAPASR